MPVFKAYEAWRDADGSISFGPAEATDSLRSKGLIGDAAKLLHRITATTWEEAMTIHHSKMEWEPYKPTGDPKRCPNECGADYYPAGSGDCPNCGNIG